MAQQFQQSPPPGRPCKFTTPPSGTVPSGKDYLSQSTIKLRIAQRLDAMGIPFIEGGWPGANPKDVQFFWRLQEVTLTQAQVTAFCSTRRPGKTADEDSMLQPVLRRRHRLDYPIWQILGSSRHCWVTNHPGRKPGHD